MWSGGISKRNPVRPAGKWAQGLTCQTAKSPACHIQFVELNLTGVRWLLIHRIPVTLRISFILKLHYDKFKKDSNRKLRSVI